MIFQVIEVLIVLTISIVVIDVHSQIVFENPENYCDRTSRCMLLQRCSTLSNNPNANVRSCGGNRRNRRVCCPISRNATPPRPVQTPPMPPRPPVQMSPPRPSIVQAPPRPPPRSFNVGGSPGFVTGQQFSSECGESKADSGIEEANFLTPLILGGQNATEGMFPWMVAVTMWERRPQAYTPYCSGFLIDRRHVVSAAHCFEDKRLELYQARIGRVDQTQGEIYSIVRIVSHEGYRPRIFYDDIAILTLERPVTNPNIVPICLPTQEVLREIDTMGLTVAGWGRTTLRNNDLSLFLQYLPQLEVVSNQNCNRIIRNSTGTSYFQTRFAQGINQGFICAGIAAGGKDACGGDSGGPLMVSYNFKWYAVGVVSFGISCGRPGIPAGYTRISEYMDWISENTRD